MTTLAKSFKILVGICCIAAASVVYYNFRYKYHDLGYGLYGGLLIGWLILCWPVLDKFYTPRQGDYNITNRGKQLGVTAVVLCLIIGNIYLVDSAEENRENDIMTNEPTAYTTVLVTRITETHGRSGTYYDAQLQYTVNGEVIFQQTPNNSHYLKAGDSYRLKYSVKYPEMLSYIVDSLMAKNFLSAA